jgi:hypothetical protein
MYLVTANSDKIINQYLAIANYDELIYMYLAMANFDIIINLPQSWPTLIKYYSVPGHGQL